MTAALRPELPRPVPDRILELPVVRGYPVPWFVAWSAEGEPDFRVVRPRGFEDAVLLEACWICGKRLGSHRAFVLGPMCAVNRTSSEPPGHVDCAEWSARACPFLSRPQMTRREGGGLTEDAVEPDGIMLRRNPGVALVWKPVPGTPHLRTDAQGRRLRLFDIGAPESVSWWAHGLEATRAEVEESIETGYPALLELAEKQSPRAVRYLEQLRVQAMTLLPAA